MVSCSFGSVFSGPFRSLGQCSAGRTGVVLVDGGSVGLGGVVAYCPLMIMECHYYSCLRSVVTRDGDY